MALTAIQRHVCRLIAADRRERGESDVAGGVALNELIGSPRVSDDIDLFHDTHEAVAATWERDRHRLEAEGLSVRTIRERPEYVERAMIS